MKICMLVYSYPPLSVGGAERQCRLQANELVRQGHGCMVLTARSQWGLSRNEANEGVSIRRVAVAQLAVNFLLGVKSRFQKKSPPVENPSESAAAVETEKQHVPVSCFERWVAKCNSTSFMWNAGWYIFWNRKKIDVVHTHVASWNAGFVAWLGSRLKIPVVCKAANLPAFDDFQSEVPFASFWKKWRLRCSFFALTAEMKVDLIGAGVPENQIRVLPNGVVLPEKTAEVALSKRVIFVGNFTQGVGHKSYDVLLKSWAIASRKFPEWDLYLAGGGDISPWEKMAEELGCRPQVEFAGRVDSLAEAYRESALFILVSRKEGISNALLEAQSYGLPGVVSDIPGNRAVVVDDKTGFILPHGDEVQTAAALCKLMQDDSLREAFGHNARKHIAECFEISFVVDQLSKNYQELLTGGFSQ